MVMPVSAMQSTVPYGRRDLPMANKIPNSVIGAVASVVGAYYYSHSKLDTLFMEK